MIIAQSHIQLILEVGILIHMGVLFLFNLITMPLSLVLMLSLVVTGLLAAAFSLDAALLILPSLSQMELTHLLGPLAVFAWVTFSASNISLKEVKIQTRSFRQLSIVLYVLIGIAGGIMHRSFLILWGLGWIVSKFIESKTYKKSKPVRWGDIRKLLILLVGGLGLMEIVSRLTNFRILSPLLRISRIEDNSVSSIKMVIDNVLFAGHVKGSCYWGELCRGAWDGYITLPMQSISNLGLDLPLFFGVLVTKKDYLDYLTPGIFTIAFEGGYISLFLVLAWVAGVTVVGLLLLKKYREKRENGSRAYLGREALLIGALTAFICQSLIGLLLFNRTINGSALIVYLFISAFILCHSIRLKRNI